MSEQPRQLADTRLRFDESRGLLGGLLFVHGLHIERFHYGETWTDAKTQFQISNLTPVTKNHDAGSIGHVHSWQPSPLGLWCWVNLHGKTNQALMRIYCDQRMMFMSPEWKIDPKHPYGGLQRKIQVLAVGLVLDPRTPTIEQQKGGL